MSIRSKAHTANVVVGPFRKAVAGGLTAGLAALITAIQEITDQGQVVQAAFNVSPNEWTVVIGAIAAGSGLVAAVPNRAKPEPEEESDPKPENEAIEETFEEPVEGQAF